MMMDQEKAMPQTPIRKEEAFLIQTMRKTQATKMNTNRDRLVMLSIFQSDFIMSITSNSWKF